MALLNRFSKLNDRTETGIFTFIVTKSVTRDFHRDATTKDFCFGYHRWAVSFQRPSERTLGVHLVLRNPLPSTSCLVDFTLTILNRRHMTLNEVYTKLQAKFSVTNPMQGVARWIQISDLSERHFSNETGEFLFELTLSNMTTIYECDLQLSANQVSQYRAMLDKGSGELLSLETNCFTFGAFEWSLAVVPLTLAPSGAPSISEQQQQASCGVSGAGAGAKTAVEPVCRVYLNRLNGLDCLCRVKYRVILGHHNQPSAHPPGQQAPHQHQQQPTHTTGGSSSNFVDSKMLDQISDSNGRIRGHQFRHTNLLELATSRGSSSPNTFLSSSSSTSASQQQASAGRLLLDPTNQPPALELRVHIEMFCANTVSECQVPIRRSPSEPQLSNCSDRNKQAWCVECDAEQEHVRLKLFFMDLKSIPRNHIRFISWCAYVVRRDPKSGQVRDSAQVRNAPHSNYYLQDSIDLGIIMDTHLPSKELNMTSCPYLSEPNQLLVHIEWVDSLLLFSHLYTNYDALATVQRHQAGRELSALKLDLEALERKYGQCKRQLNQLLSRGFVRDLDSGHSSAESPPPPPTSLLPVGSSVSPLTGPSRASSRRSTQVSSTGELSSFQLQQQLNVSSAQGADCWGSDESSLSSQLAKQLNITGTPTADTASSQQQQRLKQLNPPSPVPPIYHQQRLRRLPQQPYEGRRNSAAPRVMERAGPTGDQLIMQQPREAPHEAPRHQFKERPYGAGEYAPPSQVHSGGRAMHQPGQSHHQLQLQLHQQLVLDQVEGDELRQSMGAVEGGADGHVLYHNSNINYRLGVPQQQQQQQQHHNNHQQPNTLERYHTNTYLVDNQQLNSATPQQPPQTRHHSLYPMNADITPLLTRSLSPNPYSITPGQPQPPSLSFNDNKYHPHHNWY